MRISVTIQDHLISDLMDIAHTKNKTQAVNTAVKEWIRLKKLQKIKSFRGKLKIENNLVELRDLEISEIKGLNG